MKMVLETWFSSPFNHLTRLVAREYFIIHSRHESSRSYKEGGDYYVGTIPEFASKQDMSRVSIILLGNKTTSIYHITELL
jgi:hypothetical protein